MIYLLWGILNFALSFYLLYLCFQATKILREKKGLMAAIVFTIGIISLMNNSSLGSGSADENSSRNKSWRFAANDSVYNQADNNIRVVLEKELFSKAILNISYAKDKRTGINIPLIAYTSELGFITSSRVWRPLFVEVHNTLDKNKFEYYIESKMDWYFFGFKVYSQHRSYKDYVTLI